MGGCGGGTRSVRRTGGKQVGQESSKENWATAFIMVPMRRNRRVRQVGEAGYGLGLADLNNFMGCGIGTV